MAKVSRTLAGQVAERCARAGGVPSVEAGVVLTALCYYQARGEAPPGQEVLARELGLPRRTLTARLGELQGLSLVSRKKTSAGVEYALNAGLIREWIRGEAELERPATHAGPHARG